jgi:hypothetical protein
MNCRKAQEQRSATQLEKPFGQVSDWFCFVVLGFPSPAQVQRGDSFQNRPKAESCFGELVVSRFGWALDADSLFPQVKQRWIRLHLG